MDDTLAYEQDIKACFADIVGPRGLGKAAFEAELVSAQGALDSLREMHDGASLPLLRLPETRDDLPMIEARAAYHRERADDVVVLGTGGSSLGGQALYALADAGFGPSGGAPRLHFLDNVDPHSFDHLFRSLDFSRTDFLVVSKSGGTAETLCQFLICLQALIDAVGETAAADHVTVITEHRDSPLRQIAERFDFTVLEHDPALGGRFSVLSLVGLLPATIAGLDPAAVREGAHEVLYRTLSARDPQHSDPALGAAVNIGLWREQGIGTSVMMPYAD
ncbi:MAG: hypothetical protein MI861_10860, partial [Pirellulales bacterium]|nr:hypothetical protein [Pirellulales bacterium]